MSFACLLLENNNQHTDCIFFEVSDMQKIFGLNTTNKSFRLAMWNNISCDGI